MRRGIFAKDITLRDIHLLNYQNAISTQDRAVRNYIDKSRWAGFELPEDGQTLLLPHYDAVVRCVAAVKKAQKVVQKDVAQRRQDIERPEDDGLPTYVQITGQHDPRDLKYFRSVQEADTHEKHSRKVWSDFEAKWAVGEVGHQYTHPRDQAKLDALKRNRGTRRNGPSASRSAIRSKNGNNSAQPARGDVQDMKDVSSGHPRFGDVVNAENGETYNRSSVVDTADAKVPASVCTPEHSRTAFGFWPQSTRGAETQTKETHGMSDEAGQVPGEDQRLFQEAISSFTVEGPGCNDSGLIQICPHGIPTHFKTRALFDFKTVEKGFLSFGAGQVMYVVAILDQDCCRCIYTSFTGSVGRLHSGIVPRYLIKMPKPPSSI